MLQHRSPTLRFFRSPVTCLIRIAALVALVWYLLLLYLPAGGRTVYELTAPRGSSVAALAAELQQAGMLRSTLHFGFAARLRGVDRRLKAGDYLITSGMSPSQILNKLATGQTDARKFTLPEGYSIYQLAELLDRQQLLQGRKFLNACNNPALLKELKIDATTVEGYLYPGTYQVGFKTDEVELIRAMVQEFRRRIAGLESQAAIAGISLRQLLTLASMVEREAVVVAEKPIIASVFLNRLKIGMPLQSDPTAVYGVKVFGGKVTGADVRRASPYNTYLIKGLPPGPIGNPGFDALNAVLQPAQTDYLYFVARQDGTHQFSRSLTEHNLAVARYLK